MHQSPERSLSPSPGREVGGKGWQRLRAEAQGPELGSQVPVTPQVSSPPFPILLLGEKARLSLHEFGLFTGRREIMTFVIIIFNLVGLRLCVPGKVKS